MIRGGRNVAEAGWRLKPTWAGANLFAELDSGGSLLVEYSYYPGLDRLHAIGVGDSVYFGHTDAAGNIIGLVSQTKRKSASYSYDRWGHAESYQAWESLGSSAPNRARFKGALWMGEEGVEIYYMRTRWYEPSTGRFLSEDRLGLGAGLNQYAYGGNNPVSSVDPMGTRQHVVDATDGDGGATAEYGGSLMLDLLGGFDAMERFWGGGVGGGGSANAPSRSLIYVLDANEPSRMVTAILEGLMELLGIQLYVSQGLNDREKASLHPLGLAADFYSTILTPRSLAHITDWYVDRYWSHCGPFQIYWKSRIYNPNGSVQKWGIVHLGVAAHGGWNLNRYGLRRRLGQRPEEVGW